MQRRKFGRKFKFEAVRLGRERGVSVAQATRDLDVQETMLHRWVKQAAADLEDDKHDQPGEASWRTQLG